MGNSGQRRNVIHPKEWVGKWFDVDGTRLGRNGSPDSVGIGKIDKARRTTQCGEIISKKVAGQVVELIRRQKVATVRQQREQDTADRGHPGTHRNRSFCALQIGDLQLQTANRRIASRRVGKVWSLAAAHGLDLAIGLKRKGHILIKGHTVRPGRRVGRFTGVNASRAETSCSGRQDCSRSVPLVRSISACLAASQVLDPAGEWYPTVCFALLWREASEMSHTRRC